MLLAGGSLSYVRVSNPGAGRLYRRLGWVPALDPFDRDHAADRADGGKRRREQRVWRLFAQHSNPDQKRENYETDSVREARVGRRMLIPRSKPDEEQDREKPKLNP